MANGEQSEPAAVPLAEAAARLGISSDALRMRIRRGKARAFKDGRNVFVYMDETGPAAGPTLGPTEQRPNSVAGAARGAAPPVGVAAGDPWSILVESQKQETTRLIGEVERLNRRLDRQLDEARELRQMLQREQVLRQQEQSLRHELQDMLERLVARPALAGPPAEAAPGEGSRIIMRATAPRGTEAAAEAGPSPETAPEAAAEPAPEAAAREAAPPSPEEPHPQKPVTAPPADLAPKIPPEVPPGVAPGAEDLADMLKEIGQSLRDLEGTQSARERDPEDERRAAARVMSRLFRSRPAPRPPDS